jgi:hypothetical protein
MIRGFTTTAGAYNPTDERGIVTINGSVLDRRYSGALGRYAGGFAWGYLGSGPQHLALALLVAFADDQTALKLFHAFLHEVIASWPTDQPFSYPVSALLAWIEAHASV